MLNQVLFQGVLNNEGGNHIYIYKNFISPLFWNCLLHLCYILLHLTAKEKASLLLHSAFHIPDYPPSIPCLKGKCLYLNAVVWMLFQNPDFNTSTSLKLWRHELHAHYSEYKNWMFPSINSDVTFELKVVLFKDKQPFICISWYFTS